MRRGFWDPPDMHVRRLTHPARCAYVREDRPFWRCRHSATHAVGPESLCLPHAILVFTLNLAFRVHPPAWLVRLACSHEVVLMDGMDVPDYCPDCSRPAVVSMGAEVDA